MRDTTSGADLNIRYQVTVSQLSTSEKPTSASLHVAAATANGLSILNLNSSTWIPAGTADKAYTLSSSFHLSHFLSPPFHLLFTVPLIPFPPLTFPLILPPPHISSHSPSTCSHSLSSPFHLSHSLSSHFHLSHSLSSHFHLSHSLSSPFHLTFPLIPLPPLTFPLIPIPSPAHTPSFPFLTFQLSSALNTLHSLPSLLLLLPLPPSPLTTPFPPRPHHPTLHNRTLALHPSYPCVPPFSVLVTTPAFPRSALRAQLRAIIRTSPPSTLPSLSLPSSCQMPASFYVLVTTPAFPKGALRAQLRARFSHALSLPSLRFRPRPLPSPLPPPFQMPSSFYVLVTTPAFPKGALRAQLEASLFTKLAGCSRGFGC
ncbi:unnamed protein product [Closterium sp. Naga37s-1]|nr:unnamed protein product [Closterium sp. Naga37s-1]